MGFILNLDSYERQSIGYTPYIVQTSGIFINKSYNIRGRGIKQNNKIFLLHTSLLCQSISWPVCFMIGVIHPGLLEPAEKVPTIIQERGIVPISELGRTRSTTTFASSLTSRQTTPKCKLQPVPHVMIVHNHKTWLIFSSITLIKSQQRLFLAVVMAVVAMTYASLRLRRHICVTFCSLSLKD